MDAAPVIEAVESTACWRAAKHWLLVWTSAGFPPKIEDDKILMPAGWMKKFPDGPELLKALRTEVFSLARDGNKAVLADPRLKIAYTDHVRGRIEAEEVRAQHCRLQMIRAQEAIVELKKELEPA
jgi:hypothetical protein